MSSVIEKCQRIRVFAFVGDRSPQYYKAFQRMLDDEEQGVGPGPTAAECLIYAGHAGVSLDGGATIYGFGPDGAGVTKRQLFDALRNGDAFPGVVSDDAQVFGEAKAHGLSVDSMEVLVKQDHHDRILQALAAERQASHYTYGFPNGDDDCNCATWIERLGVPMITGRMVEFLGLMSILPKRRFGKCEE